MKLKLLLLAFPGLVQKPSGQGSPAEEDPNNGPAAATGPSQPFGLVLGHFLRLGLKPVLLLGRRGPHAERHWFRRLQFVAGSGSEQWASK